MIREILPNKVLLERQGKRLQLCFVDNLPSTQTARPADKPLAKPAVAAECGSGVEGKDLKLLLEKAQKGDVGLGDLLPLLSSSLGKKE